MHIGPLLILTTKIANARSEQPGFRLAKVPTSEAAILSPMRVTRFQSNVRMGSIN